MKQLICLTSMILLCSLAGFANIARPNTTPSRVPKPKAASSIVTTMSIQLDRDATQARLIIPKAQLKQLRADLDELDYGSDNTAAVTSPDVSRTQTIMSGLFLSLALVFGGMWFVSSGKAATKAGKSLVIVAVVAGIASAATYVYANAGPPPEARTINGKMFSGAVHAYGAGWGKVKLEAGTEDSVTLIVPNPREEKPSE